MNELLFVSSVLLQMGIPTMATRLSPRFLYYKGKVQEKLSISFDPNGAITAIEPTPSGEKVENVLLLPGFVNSHSHAFHRHLRGRSEIGGTAAETFWAWRDNMYALVDGVTEDKLYKYCASTFQEMLSAGITTVGEFHYVHHGVGRFDLDKAVIRAANDVGIRIVLIQTLYERAGFTGGDLHPVQTRFTSSYDEFVENLDSLLKEAGPTVTIAVAAHSARAVPLEDIKKLHELSIRKGLAFHMHLEEQPKEIMDCRAVHQKSPSDLLLENLSLDGNFTAVHATFTSAENMKNMTDKGVNISVCPLTEGYLGDGIPVLTDKTHISFGTDCNNRIAFLEEMRWACYTQQMKHNSRSVAGLSAHRLFSAATEGGARSLKLLDSVGIFEVGKQFDAMAIDLSSPLLEGITAEQAVDGIVFGCGNREVQRVYVAGHLRYPV